MSRLFRSTELLNIEPKNIALTPYRLVPIERETMYIPLDSVDRCHLKSPQKPLDRFPIIPRCTCHLYTRVKTADP